MDLKTEALSRPVANPGYMAPEERADTVNEQVPLIVDALLEHGVVDVWAVHRDQPFFEYVRYGFIAACELVAHVPGVEVTTPTPAPVTPAVPETPDAPPAGTSD